jgi:heptosyltransferase-3
MSPSAKILVIRGGAIGDFILTLPVFAALRRQFPELHLEVLGYPHIARLALLDGTVNAVKPIEARALAGFFARGGVLDPDWSDYFCDFAVILSYLYDPDEIFRTNIARCAPGQYIQGPHRPGGALPLHAAKTFLKPLERLAIFAPDPVPRIRLPRGPAPARPRVALHPGSGSEKKNWPEQHWAELCRLILAQTGTDLLLVGGEAEGERIPRLAANLPRERTFTAQSLPLPDLARALAGCSSFIGHDSGISHLAGALDLDALLLWGDTPEEVWRPLNPRVSVHRPAAGLSRLTAPEVFEKWLEWTR